MAAAAAASSVARAPSIRRLTGQKGAVSNQLLDFLKIKMISISVFHRDQSFSFCLNLEKKNVLFNNLSLIAM